MCRAHADVDLLHPDLCATSFFEIQLKVSMFGSGIPWDLIKVELNKAAICTSKVANKVSLDF